MSKPLFIYRCPACRTIHEVSSDDIYRSYLFENICHQCPVCKRRTVLVYESYYWKDHKPHLNPDIDILYYDDYLKRLNKKKK